MRLILTLKSEDSFVYSDINNYLIQSMIWNSLRGTDLSELHDYKLFKFFSFSNMFPVENFIEGGEYKLIISSPSKLFIDTLNDKLNDEKIRLGKHKFKVEEIKKVKIPLGRIWKLGSPLVLYKNNDTLEYFSFERNKDFEFFFNRIKDNAIKKFKLFYNLDKFEFKFFMFDYFKFKRTVIHEINKNNHKFIIIGTTGEFGIPKLHSGRMRKFYSFMMDTGLGEKNSLGYGFVNPIKEK